MVTGGQQRDSAIHIHVSVLPHSSPHGEGDGNSLQCSCLENPMDGGAWCTAIYGVAQSRTRLKPLSSSSSILPQLPSHPGCHITLRRVPCAVQ